MPGPETSDLAAVAAAFGQQLHDAGVPVTPERSARFAAAVLVARPASIDSLYWTARVSLLTARDQVEVFDDVFARVFRGASTRATPEPRIIEQQSPTPSEGLDEDDGDGDGTSLLATASAQEILRTRDFSLCTPEELALIADLVARLPLAAPTRLGRRYRGRRHGDRLDVRATLRRSRHTGGDPVTRMHRRRIERPRRIVLVADVSGSMEPYARVYLHLLTGAVRATRAEAFVFATRLTRLTRLLRSDHPDIAYARAAAAATDWSGGTRIGQSLKEFNDRYARGGLARGAVVVIVSDGWEVQDPELVGEQMERLHRLAHRIVWVNPRKAGAGYEPLVGGMAAALPHVDTFVSGHSVRSLEEVVRAIAAD